MYNVCIIPARAGSRRIPLKNIKEFHGKPIIAYSIKTAQESEMFDKIIVSTDSELVAGVATAYGAEVHMRSNEMCLDKVGTQAVTRNVLQDYGISHKWHFACCLYPTSPLLEPLDLKLAYRSVSIIGRNYVASVGIDPLRDAGNFYFGRSLAFIKEHPLWHRDTVLQILPENRICDINTMDDWERAEKMYMELHEHHFKLVTNEIPEMVHFKCDCGTTLPT